MWSSRDRTRTLTQQAPLAGACEPHSAGWMRLVLARRPKAPLRCRVPAARPLVVGVWVGWMGQARIVSWRCDIRFAPRNPAAAPSRSTGACSGADRRQEGVVMLVDRSRLEEVGVRTPELADQTEPM